MCLDGLSGNVAIGFGFFHAAVRFKQFAVFADLINGYCVGVIALVTTSALNQIDIVPFQSLAGLTSLFGVLSQMSCLSSVKNFYCLRFRAPLT